MSAQTALRGHLEYGFTALTVLSTKNRNPPPGARPRDGFVTMDFPGGDEDQVSFGNPGRNVFREIGVAQVHIYVKAGDGEEAAVSYGDSIRTLFRGAKIITTESPARVVRVHGVDPVVTGPGSADGAYFRATVAFEYEIDNFG